MTFTATNSHENRVHLAIARAVMDLATTYNSPIHYAEGTPLSLLNSGTSTAFGPTSPRSSLTVLCTIAHRRYHGLVYVTLSYNRDSS